MGDGNQTELILISFGVNKAYRKIPYNQGFKVSLNLSGKNFFLSVSWDIFRKHFSAIVIEEDVLEFAFRFVLNFLEALFLSI